MPRHKDERRPSGSQTARLPRLHREVVKPNFNRKAQDIIAAHMYEEPSDALRARDAPLLQQIDGTAPRTARSHDISHLQDGAGALRPVVPPSLMKQSDYVHEPSFLPRDATSVYSDEDGMWHTLVFPSDQPSSRADAVHLDTWITRSLAKKDGDDGRPRSMEDLVGTLSVAIREVSRQVTHHCVERGQVLDRIWRTYVELFDRVMHQMRGLLTAQRRQTAQAQERLTLLREELKGFRKTHPEDMHKVISALEEKFSQEQKQLEEKLKKAQEEGVKLKHELRAQHREIEAWFPGFALYQDSPLRSQLTFLGRASTAAKRLPNARVEGDGMSPDVALAEDFKRLLSAINPEKRREIGQELADMIEVSGPGPSGKQQGAREAEETSSNISKVGSSAKDHARQAKEQKAVEALQLEVRGQEERIRQLRREIMAFEASADQEPEGDAGVEDLGEGGGGGEHGNAGGGDYPFAGSESDGESSGASIGSREFGGRKNSLLKKGFGAVEMLAGGSAGLAGLMNASESSDSDA